MKEHQTNTQHTTNEKEHSDGLTFIKKNHLRRKKKTQPKKKEIFSKEKMSN